MRLLRISNGTNIKTLFRYIGMYKIVKISSTFGRRPVVFSFFLDVDDMAKFGTYYILQSSLKISP